MKVPTSHPRYDSLKQREKILEGLEKGFVAEAGLIAQGRGECFDYLLGERTTKEAKEAERAAVALLLLAKNPIISVNGNVAALVPKGIVKLAEVLEAKVEINLFYWSKERVGLIEKILRKEGVKEVFGVDPSQKEKIPHLDSKRGQVDKEGIYKADVVLVSLEDGDRTESLVRLGKKVIAIDLNPLSRTAQKADITVVNNVVRAIPEMIEIAKELRKEGKWKEIVREFDNKSNLETSIKRVRKAI